MQEKDQQRAKQLAHRKPVKSWCLGKIARRRCFNAFGKNQRLTSTMGGSWKWKHLPQTHSASRN
eukprot:46790-Karenia_brevis.AAC.1